jgi:hypothetical protein
MATKEKQFPFGSLSRHLFRPMRGGAAAVVIIFALLLSIRGRAGLLGIPLYLIVSSWFFKYAYILFDHTARGFDDPPVLDIQMMNPLNEQRPLAQAIIIAAFIFALVYVNRTWGAVPTALLGVLIGLMLPASVAVLGLEGSVIRAANPLSWFQMAYGLGYLYALVLALLAAEVFGIYLLLQLDLWTVVSTAIGMFGVLSVFSLLGGAVYERRDALGIEAWASPERVAERERKQEHRQDEAVITEAYGLMRAASHVKSWEMLQNWLKTRNNSVDAYHWLCGRVELWEDPRYITRLTEEFVERLMHLKRSGEALSVIIARLRKDEGFRPKSAADTLSLAQLAARGGGSPRVARTLLSNFAARFPGDPRTPLANELARHLTS